MRLNAAPSSSGRASCSNRSSGGVCSSSGSTRVVEALARRRKTSGILARGAAITATPREKQGPSSLTFSTLSGPLARMSSSDSLSVAPYKEGETTTVRFWLKFKTNWGEGVKLIGSHPKLGSWTIANAVELRWAEGDAWTVTAELPPGVYEYKYVVIDYSTKQPKAWQQGGNSVLAISVGEKEVDVHDNWGNNPGAEVRTEGESMTRENKLQQWASNLVSQFLVVNKEKDEVGAQLAEARMENQVVKGELGRVKMELGLMQQAQRERDVQVATLKEQNIRLQQDLTQAQQELASSFAEALQLLEDDDEDDFFRAESEASRNGKASSNGKASFSTPSNNGSTSSW